MVSLRQIVIFGMVFASATLIGYDFGYLNGVLGSPDFIRRYGVTDDENGITRTYLTPWTRALFSSLVAVGTLLVGRKGSLFFTAAAYAIGVSMQVAAPPPAVFILGRIFLGMALGFVSIVSTTYFVESSSATTRGRLIALYTQLLTCGNVLACGINMGTSKLQGPNSWRVTIAFQLVLAFIIFLGAILAPESPEQLIKRGKTEEARLSLAALRNIAPESEEMAQAEDEIRNIVAEQVAFGEAQLVECFQGPNLRRTLLGTAMGFMTIATGITFWFGYGTTFFIAAGVENAYLVSLILALTNATFTGPSVYLVEKVGRRASLIWGGVIMGVTQLIIAVIHTTSPGSKADHIALIAGSVLFIAAYAATWGAVGWVTMTEPYSARLRVRQTTITMLVYWTSTWAVGFVTPYLVDASAANLGVNVCYLWFGMVVLSVGWAALCVPELSGLSVSEVDLLFERKVSALRSVSWKKDLRLRTVDGVEADVEDTEISQAPLKGVGKREA